MSSNRQPEALRLADWLDDQYDPDNHKADAASELRRLYAENQSLQSEAEQNAKIFGASAEKELALRTQVEALEAALATSISLLQKTPKIMQNIYVGKDSQSWGAQAKAVLDAAIAAQGKQEGGA